MLRIGVFPNVYKENSDMVLRRIVNFYQDKDVKLLLPKREADFFRYSALGVDDIEKSQMDLALSIGGDGTLLGVCRRLYSMQIPICGINIGTFGFLADIELPELEGKLEKILQSCYHIEERIMLQGFVKSKGEKAKFLGRAINDVVISKGGVARMLKLSLYVDDCRIMDYKADGIIVSTATGSTAYSLSAGGPIINPKIKVLLLTPICPHTFNARPMVIDEEDEVAIHITAPDEDVVLSFDGQDSKRILQNDTVIVKKAQFPTKIVKFDDKNYYQTIRTKLLYNA